MEQDIIVLVVTYASQKRSDTQIVWNLVDNSPRTIVTVIG